MTDLIERYGIYDANGNWTGLWYNDIEDASDRAENALLGDHARIQYCFTVYEVAQDVQRVKLQHQIWAADPEEAESVVTKGCKHRDLDPEGHGIIDDPTTERQGTSIVGFREAADDLDRKTQRENEALQEYRKLHDGLSDLIEHGRLQESDIPHDYDWLAGKLAQLAGLDPGAVTAEQKTTGEVEKKG